MISTFKAFIRYSSITLVLICGLFTTSLAQTDDLMFAEYVDWTSGSGWAVKVYNPTSSSIDLSDYYLRIYRNGASVYTENEQLTGTLAAKQTIIIGNDAYCDVECSGTCGITLTTLGINGNEILELATATCTIDLIGAKGVDLGSQDGWTVDGTSGATYRQTLTRRSNNGIRYVNSDGVAPYSWPVDRSNFLGWSVSSVRCLSNGFSLSVVVPGNSSSVTLNFEDSIICAGQSLVVRADQNVDWEILENGQTLSNRNSLNFSQQAGTYRVVARSLNCGGGSDTCTVVVRDGGSIDIFGETTVCEGGSLRFYTDIQGGNLWQNITTIDTFVLANIMTDVEVIVENATTGCGLAYDTIRVTVLKKPILPTERFYSIPMTGDSTIAIDRTSSYPYSRWTVNGSEWSGSSVDYMYPEELRVCAVVGPSEECIDSSCVTYFPKAIEPDFILYVPNVITPNGDDLNDIFRVYIEGGIVEELAVYNRWGERLYEGAKDTAMWDGKYKGEVVPNGTYFYVGNVRNLSNQDTQNISGIVEVIR